MSYDKGERLEKKIKQETKKQLLREESKQTGRD
jgi:hypothetical protein